MNEIVDLANQIRCDLEKIHPKMRKTLLRKFPLLVAVMLDARTANTNELAATLPLTTPRLDMRNQWIARLLHNPLLNSYKTIEPFARQLFHNLVESGKTIKLTLDQENLNNRFDIFLLTIKWAEKSFPLVWRIETAPAQKIINIQLRILEQIKHWIPKNARVRLITERIIPGEELFIWVQGHKWQYQFRLHSDISTILSPDTQLQHLTIKSLVNDRPSIHPVSLFNKRVSTYLLAWHDPQDRSKERFFAIDSNNHYPLPTVIVQSKIGVDWVFAGFNSREFSLRNTQLQYATRLDHLILIMSVALYWCNQNSHNYCRVLNRKYQI